MRIIKPNVIELKQQPGFEGMLKHIEVVGRTCYKSEDKIAEGSYYRFVNMLREHSHGAMLEHGTVYLSVPNYNNRDHEGKLLENDFVVLTHNKYTKVNYDYNNGGVNGVAYITTNYRVVVENNLEELVNKYQTESTEYHYKRRTFKFTCNRGVSHEFVRHRVFSFAQESQRYVNYSKDKFGKEIKVIKPLYFSDEKDLKCIHWRCGCEDAEKRYFALLGCGATPQEAREVLPNATATELVMTGFESDWEGFFKLRCAKDAHPQAQEVANMLREIY